MIINLWYALREEYHVGGSVTQTTKWLELIAKLLFWAIFQNYLETPSRRKAFAHFVGIAWRE